MNEQEQLKPQNKEHSHSEDSQGQGSYTDSISESPSEIIADGQGGQKKQNLHKQCCKICKHPDKSKKACVCVVPLSQRRASLGDGCRNCGCLGCSKEDFLSKGEDPEYHPDLNSQKAAKQQAQPKRSERRQRRDRSRSHKRKASPARKKARKQTPSRSRSPQIIDSFSMKFHNFDRSIIGTMLINDYGVNPNLLGFAIPQRSYSYLFGKPR